jgi:hypothetical protein
LPSAPDAAIDRGSFGIAERLTVPTLFRFLAVIGVLAGLGFAAMVALATLVQPEQREMTVTVPPARFNR